MTTRDAPTDLIGILKELGPGLIIAGSIVGSGELIATTLMGATCGFWLMWLIIIGCVIKVFTQLEIGRYTVLTGRTTLEGLSTLPGFKLGGMHWVIWFWLAVLLIGLGQSGGIVGAIGQAAGMTHSITEKGEVFNELADAQVKAKFEYFRMVEGTNADERGIQEYPAGHETAEAALEEPIDVKVYAVIVSLITAFLLYRGGYGLIEKTVMVLVGSFTLLTLYNVLMLQMSAEWALSFANFKQGFMFQLPPGGQSGIDPMLVALAAFGMIGLSAGELIFYPYWCLEKGYAKFTGPREDTASWHKRANGWLRIMKYDAWASMVVYTLSTLMFYLLGAAVLNRVGIQPGNADLIRTLAAIFEPVFGSSSKYLFLFGAVAVLYSTFFVGNANGALAYTDIFRIFQRARNWKFKTDRLRKNLSFLLPITGCAVYLGYSSPIAMILLSGFMNTLMLPLLAFAALYYRSKHKIAEIPSSRITDIGLWISALVLLAFGLWAVWGRIQDILSRILG